MGLGLEASWSDGAFSLGLGAGDDDDSEDDEGLGLIVEAGFPVDSLETVPAMRLGLGLLWCSDEDLLLDTDDGLGFAAAEDGGRLGLDGGLPPLAVGPTALLFSLRWLLYELRLGSL